MTCQDCINLEPNTEHCNEYDIEVDVKPYRICAKMEVKEMTCKDCKHFNPNIRLKPEWTNQGLCEKRVADGYAEYPSFDCEICGMFQSKDDCWDEVAK